MLYYIWVYKCSSTASREIYQVSSWRTVLPEFNSVSSVLQLLIAISFLWTSSHFEMFLAMDLVYFFTDGYSSFKCILSPNCDYQPLVKIKWSSITINEPFSIVACWVFSILDLGLDSPKILQCSYSTVLVSFWFATNNLIHQGWFDTHCCFLSTLKFTGDNIQLLNLDQ